MRLVAFPQFLSQESHSDSPLNNTCIRGAASLTIRLIFIILYSLPRSQCFTSRNTHNSSSHSRVHSRTYRPFWRWLRSRETWAHTTGPRKVSLPHTTSPCELPSEITCWSLSLRSPLLRDSLEFSFPPPYNMRIFRR